MLYWLLQPWSDVPGLGLLEYISFRSVLAVLTAFALSLISSAGLHGCAVLLRKGTGGRLVPDPEPQ